MSVIEEKLERMDIRLPDAPPPAANYVPAVRTGNLLFLSGLGPAPGADGTTPRGKLGADLTLEQGYEAARLVGINVLARLKGALGDLDKVKRIVKLLSMVNAAPDFTQTPAVANGCSDLLVELYGDPGRHARSAVGMNALPFNIPVEIEMILEVEHQQSSDPNRTKETLMGAVEKKIGELGYALPGASTPGGNYVPSVSVPGAGLVYTAGHVARRPDGSLVVGKLGADLSIEEGYEAARYTALNLLGSLKEQIGDLDKVGRVVKLLCMVNCAPDFGQQPAVANGASDFLVEVFGEKGRHARSAVGMAALPNNVCIEIEMIVEVSG